MKNLIRTTIEGLILLQNKLPADYNTEQINNVISKLKVSHYEVGDKPLD